jgi:endonuclease G, mitochondrial
MKLRLAVVLATCVLIVQSAFAVSNTIVISQVYGGGGNAGATLKNDFIELFNRGTTTVNVTGWSVQYASSAGTTWQVTNLSGSIAPGHYYLVQEAPGAGGTVNLPTPDATGTIMMSATGAKVALVSSTIALSGSCPTTNVVDFVGYDGANCFEGAPTPTLGNTTAALRNASGCTDTDNNGADFTVGSPNPRNSASATTTCGNNPPTITPPANPITIVDQDAPPFTVNVTGNDDGGIYNWSATPGTGVASVSVTGGQGTATATFRVTLQTGFSGIAKFTASLSDNVNSPPTTQIVNIKVNAPATNNPPSITAPANPITSVAQNAAPFTVNLTGSDDGAVYNWSATPGTGVATVSVTGGQGTATATFTVTLQTGFNGTATFTASLSDNVNPAVTQAVNIAVVPPPDHLVISQIYGGGGNSGATYKNDYVQLFNPTATPVDITGWTLQYASAAGSSWTNIQPLGGVIGPGEYYLVALASGGNAGLDLPLANISGSINMSATAGKIALVRNGIPLSGICPLIGPPADPDVVDFLGYGTTANCSEGNANAPAPSNTTALFRRNGGNTDSNNNGADFTAGAPNPFRTTPPQEFGPWVSSTDPRLDGTGAPHDSSITVDFSEPVDVDSNWYDITCVSSGAHNSATVAHTFDFKEHVITPNTNFQFGEQCTVTIYKNTIHDQDLDDSAPNTDTLAANYTWSFTVVAAGQAAPYPPSVHLTMGNPTNATADVTLPNNYLMEKPTYALSYNKSKGTPNWVSWHLEPAWFGSLARVDTFRPDPAIPPDWYRVQAFDFFTTGFDRGHMTPNADRDNENRIPINQETYLMSNMVPQAPGNNQGPWADLENYLRGILNVGGQEYEMYIVSGPAGVGGIGSNGFATTLANGHVTVPAYTWKAALVLPKGDNDVSRVTAATRTIAVIMPNTDGIRNDDWMNYLKTVDQVETLCSCNLFSNVPEIVQNSIEAGVNGVNPPGVANQTTSTREDTPDPITLNAVSPDSGATFTYTVTQPAHGTLAGSGATRTYTPAPDFNGNDSFTFSVNDGHFNSNTATVSISVLEVNDAPNAASDAKSTEAGSVLTFPASDLIINDTPGPENESTQTLSVTGVMNTPETHGAVVLAAGQVTYTPMVPYAGPASFTYRVCDNGFTAGLSDPQCATGTVNVNVTDTAPPTISNFSLSVTELWPANHQMVDLTVAYNVFDLGDPIPTCSLIVTSNEPVNGTGDGNTSPDWEVVDGHHVRLRAERAGSGTGRIYTIETDCTDRFGNTAQKSAFVTVPKSKGR